MAPSAPEPTTTARCVETAKARKMANAFRVRDENGAGHDGGGDGDRRQHKASFYDKKQNRPWALGSHYYIPRRAHSTKSQVRSPTQNIQPCSANGRGAGKSRRRTARKVSKHRSRRERERERGRGTNQRGRDCWRCCEEEGREEGGSQPTGHLSEAPIKYPAKNISRDLWLLSKGENTLEKLSQTLQASG